MGQANYTTGQPTTMSNAEIISNVLDQLIERFHLDSTTFRSGQELNTMLWWNADDQTAPRTIYMSLHNGKLKLIIFCERITAFRDLEYKASEDIIKSDRTFETFRLPARKLRRLIKLIENKDEIEKTKKIVSKLTTAFPTLFDHHLLGK